MKKQKVIYKITQTFKTSKKNPTYEELKKILIRNFLKLLCNLKKMNLTLMTNKIIY